MLMLLNPGKKKRAKKSKAKRKGPLVCVSARSLIRKGKVGRPKMKSLRKRARKVLHLRVGSHRIKHRTKPSIKRVASASGLPGFLSSGYGAARIASDTRRKAASERMKARWAAKRAAASSSDNIFDPEAQRWLAANPRRRSYRRRHGRKVARNYVPPVWAYNPGLTDAATVGFKPGVLKGALPLFIGAAANTLATSLIGPRVSGALGLSGDMLNLGTLGLGLATAGLLGYAARMVKPEYTNGVFAGAMGQVLYSAWKMYGADKLQAATGLGGFDGLGLCGACPSCCGMGESLTPDDIMRASNLGDVLTPEAVAAAVPLG